MRHFFITLLLISVYITGMTQETGKTGKVQWMDFQTALKKQKENPRIIFIDMYTDWCGWCKKLDKVTFSDPDIASYINNNFYPVKFNAEGFDTVKYKGKTYINEGKGKRSTHQLALKFLNNEPSYPSTVFLTPEGEYNKIPGFLKPKKFQPILIYFAEEINKTCPYKKYKETYDFLYASDGNTDMNVSGNINWLTLKEALLKQTQNPKKIMFLFYSDTYQKVSSELMLKVIMKNPIIAEYVNNNFYPVLFDAARTDTINMFDNQLINKQKAPGYPHQFVFHMLRNKIKFPSIGFLNEENKIIPPVQGFFYAGMIEPYLHFIATDAFRNNKWQAYYENFTGKIKTQKK